MKKPLIFSFLVLVLFASLAAQPGLLSLQPFATGFSEPLFLTHAGDDRIFVVEKAGKIYILNQAGQRNPTPFLDIDSRVNSASSERGLLGLAFHPQYKQNGYFYLNYTNASGATVIARFSVSSNPDLADPNSEEILMTIVQPFPIHNGGCINFGADGYLYIGNGDGGNFGDPGNRAQNGQELLGKMLRIDVDHGLPYSVPASNPYTSSSTIRNEIWAFGLRNPWRWSFDRITHDMWIADVGQAQIEEIDYWQANAPTSANFGWRCYEGNQAFDTSGCQTQNNYDAPIFTYNHSQGNCSVTGGYVYRGARHASLWGNYFHADYCSGYLWWTAPNGSGGWNTTRNTTPFTTFNLVSFGEDHFGALYLTGLADSVVYRLADTTCKPKAYITGGDSVTICMPDGVLSALSDPSLNYQWQLGSNDIVGATHWTLSPTTPGDYRVIVRNGACADTSDAVHVIMATSPLVTLSLPDTNYCENAPSVQATVSPVGGTLLGPGISGLNFDPSAAGIGHHILSYTYTDPQSGCMGVDTFGITISVCTSVEPAPSMRMRLAPNPNNGSFMLKFIGNSSEIGQISIQDLHGKTVHSFWIESQAGDNQYKLEALNLVDGFYFMTLQLGSRRSTSKFVVQRK